MSYWFYVYSGGEKMGSFSAPTEHKAKLMAYFITSMSSYKTGKIVHAYSMEDV